MIVEIKYNKDGLVPAIAQDAVTGKVLMQAYMNEEAVEKTLETKYVHYYSRSRDCLWKKGETSGHLQKLVSFALDCDCDCVLVQVEQTGPACHTGTKTCFFNEIEKDTSAVSTELFCDLYDVVADRKTNPKDGSYTNYLFEKGIDKILKKVGEECAEVIIASKNEGTEELKYEISDLLYHLIVLMNEKGLTWKEVLCELNGRR